MKQITQLLFAALLINTLIGCQSNSTDSTSLMATTVANVDENRDSNSKTKLLDAKNAQAMDRFSLADVKVDLKTMEMVAMQQMSAENADEQAIMNINQALMTAQKEAQLLDVKFSMSDEPVDNGVFIFSIESADAKKLTLEMFDEEGYSMTANNKFTINGGNNYKALNVNSMENGAYLFRLKDDMGKELVRSVNIANK